jgi:hypothetical protein
VTGVAVLAGGCGGFVGEAFVNRRANLAAKVVTSDGRTGVPCTVTALVLDEEDAQATVAAGDDVVVVVGMLTPAKAEATVKARVALRVACEGYAPVTTPEQETTLAMLNVPMVDFGTVTIRESELQRTRGAPATVPDGKPRRQ